MPRRWDRSQTSVATRLATRPRSPNPNNPPRTNLRRPTLPPSSNPLPSVIPADHNGLHDCLGHPHCREPLEGHPTGRKRRETVE